jgi:hypothetical protein
MRRPDLSIKQILAWLDDFHERTGRWPMRKDHRLRIPGGLGDTWCAITLALQKGLRSLPGGSSLAKLVAEQRGAKHRLYPPDLSLKQLLQWAHAHRRRTGAWPTTTSGTIPGTGGETWIAVQNALRHGKRGLAGGTTLARVLLEHRGVRSSLAVPDLSLKQIVA